MNKIEILKSELLFEHKRFNIKRDSLLLDNYPNEYIYVDKKDAVGIIALLEDEVWLVEQYRHSVGQRLLEIPGGRLEKRESPKEAAIRELHEETGLIATNIELFTTIFIHPSLCNETVHIFLATEFSLDKQILEKSELDLKIKKIKMKDLNELLLSNKITSAPDGYVLSLLLLQKMTTK